MQAELIIALAIAIPVVMFPVAFVGYLTIGGIRAAAQEARVRKTAAAKVTAR